MGEQKLSAKLPVTELGSCRAFEAGYTAHGDLMVSVKDTARATAPQVQAIVMKHGSEVDFMACIIGFHKRMNESIEAVTAEQHKFCDSIGPLETDELQLEYQDLTVDSLRFVLSGTRFPKQDRAEFGWQYLHGPVPPHPGAKSRGVMFYTRVDLFGNPSLLLTSRGVNDSRASGTTPSESIFAEFCPDDMPVVAQTLRQLSAGEYRAHIDFIIQKSANEHEANMAS